MNCDIIQDLLPLYHDGVCSAASQAAVKEHLASCKTCREALSALDAPLPEKQKAAARMGDSLSYRVFCFASDCSAYLSSRG